MAIRAIKAGQKLAFLKIFLIKLFHFLIVPKHKFLFVLRQSGIIKATPFSLARKEDSQGLFFLIA